MPDVEGVRFYLDCYSDLATCRSYGMGYGPIPWLAIKEYCTFYAIELSMLNLIVRGIDSIFLEYINGKSEKDNTNTG